MNNFKLQTARWYWDTDGGQQTNMGVHEMEVATLGRCRR